MRVSGYLDVAFPDGSAVRLELTAVGEPTAVVPADADLPDGFGSTVPVARRSRTAQIAVDGLRSVLRPLGPLLQEIREAVAAGENPPREVTVAFGLQIGQDLKLGVVGAAGQATMTVSATWGEPGTQGQG